MASSSSHLSMLACSLTAESVLEVSRGLSVSAIPAAGMHSVIVWQRHQSHSEHCTCNYLTRFQQICSLQKYACPQQLRKGSQAIHC